MPKLPTCLLHSKSVSSARTRVTAEQCTWKNKGILSRDQLHFFLYESLQTGSQSAQGALDWDEKFMPYAYAGWLFWRGRISQRAAASQGYGIGKVGVRYVKIFLPNSCSRQVCQRCEASVTQTYIILQLTGNGADSVKLSQQTNLTLKNYFFVFWSAGFRFYAFMVLCGGWPYARAVVSHYFNSFSVVQWAELQAGIRWRDAGSVVWSCPRERYTPYARQDEQSWRFSHW